MNPVEYLWDELARVISTRDVSLLNSPKPCCTTGKQYHKHAFGICVCPCHVEYKRASKHRVFAQDIDNLSEEPGVNMIPLIYLRCLSRNHSRMPKCLVGCNYIIFVLLWLEITVLIQFSFSLPLSILPGLVARTLY